MSNGTKCRSCGAPIVFLWTKRGSKMPVDRDSVNKGDEVYEHDRHSSHFDTCPNADKHRKR